MPRDIVVAVCQHGLQLCRAEAVLRQVWVSTSTLLNQQLQLRSL